MRGFPEVMAATSLSTLLTRAVAATASSRPFFASSPTSASAGARLRRPSRSRRGFGRPPIATAFPDDLASLARFTSTAIGSSAAAVEGARTEPAGARRPVPAILLAGFLGSGKTTALKHLLENNSDIKIGTIVNDVASVNIDAKLVSGSECAPDDIDALAEGVVELQNGCACCSLADELLTSVVRLTDGGRRDLDAIIVELSGVADPVAVRDNWEEARQQGHPATRIASLQRTVTLVDACTFGTDWMTWDVAGERDGWTDEGDLSSMGMRKVPELLAEQVEAADLLLVNKIDLAGEGQVGVASGIARGLNEKASLIEVEFGRVGARDLLGEVLEEEEKKEDAHLHNGHDHSHGHSSDHDHSHKEASARTDSDCTTLTSHSHSHEHSSDGNDSDCTDSSHSHAHEHTSECDDPNCTDTSHSHSHDHKPQTATDQLGITSFVYKAVSPFNSNRLLALLEKWPVPIKDSLDFGQLTGKERESNPVEDAEALQPFSGVLRSKGFCWMSPTNWATSRAGGDAWRHDTAMYWSHAGKHFGIISAGKWWGSISKDQMKPYFANNMEEYHRIMREDWVSEDWGDRRQELVFIGANMKEDVIRAALDECLCTEDEMEVYRSQLRKYLDTSY